MQNAKLGRLFSDYSLYPTYPTKTKDHPSLLGGLFIERQTGLEPAQLRCIFDIYTPDPLKGAERVACQTPLAFKTKASLFY